MGKRKGEFWKKFRQNRRTMEYTAKNIKVLKGLEAVRKRPGMYIGDTSEKGLHHLIFEVVDNSIDEAMAGHASKIAVTLKKDGSVVISDNGRGIPVDIHPEEGKPAATLVLTTLHAGGKFDSKTYKVSGGLHGVGVSVVNALAEKLIMEIKRGGKKYRQVFSRGKELTPLEVVEENTRGQGTTIQFYPDPEIFENTTFKKEIVVNRLKELAYLNPGVEIRFKDERDGTSLKFYFEGGIKDFLQEIVKKEPLTDTIYFSYKSPPEKKRRFEIEVALLYDSGFDEKILSYVNNIRTIEGGTHESGFKAGLSKGIINYISQNYNLKDLKINGEDTREGLKAIISVKLNEPQFEGQTKTKLGDSFVKSLTQKITYEQISRYLEENPSDARTIADKAITSAKSRLAAKKARELIRKQAKIGGVATLPGKLTECQSKNPEERELYLVEGDSAGGSAKQGRDRRFQAILPLRGKILNTQKAGELKLLESEEIKNIITALGTGIGEDFDLEKLRYHKVIIMTDADVDGSHIQTLIMTFFFNHFPELIEKGHLFIAQPPLYRYKKGKKEVYLKDDRALNRLLIEEGIKNLELPWEEKEAIELLEKVALYSSLLQKLSKIFGIKEIIRYLVEGGTIDNLEKFLQERGYRLVSKSGDRYYIQTQRGIEEVIINDRLFNHPYFKEARELAQTIAPYQKEVEQDLISLLEELLQKEMKRADIQRYKGLGEMNPDQLWETTMNPENRVLLKVTMEDAQKAQEKFELLMGNEVAPRREFIQQHAKEVENLDI